MKTRILLLCFATTAGIIAGCATPNENLSAQAQISKADATKTALSRVPNGTVSSAELEKEHGKLIWSFDIATAGSPNITEVAVDAISGKVIAVDTETPAAQAKEKAADAKRPAK